jgi:hypothetical protein
MMVMHLNVSSYTFQDPFEHPTITTCFLHRSNALYSDSKPQKHETLHLNKSSSVR